MGFEHLVYNDIIYNIIKNISGENIMSNLIWVGARESDKEYTGDFFNGSITLYGGRKQENKAFCLTKDYRINHNHITSEQTNFMVKNELRLIQKNPDIKFMSYNPNLIYGCNEEIVKRTVCLNDEKLMRFLDSKITFRRFSEKFVHTLHSELLYGDECIIENLRKIFPEYNKWIIQSDIASGGYKTFILEEGNKYEIEQILKKDEKYLVSPYYEKNIPINIHAVIYEKEILLTPGSVQIMRKDRNRMLYRGADYITYQNIAKNVREKYEEDILKLCKEIQKLGYRGIIGIDAIIVDDIAWVLEVNNRFQASTILVNKALKENNLPSLHELNYESFNKEYSELIDIEKLFLLDVPYSIYTYIEGEQSYHTDNFWNICKNEKRIKDLIDDGYISWQDAEEEAYLFRVIFNTNITSISSDNLIRIHPNIKEPDIRWYQDILSNNRDRKKLKIALLNQGVILSEEVKQYLLEKGGMREGVYFSVDLKIENQYIVNAPLAVKFVPLSPFKIKLIKGKLKLYYYGKAICDVDIDFTDKIAQMSTSRGIPIARMCLLATDRLRVQNCYFCTFKEAHVPCRFCEAQYKDIEFDIEDILEALEIYFKPENRNAFKHVLIGGLSNKIGMEKSNIKEIAKYIRKYSDMGIYLMALPSVNIDDIEEYVQAGVTEIGFNIEIFDRNIAKEYMPGKGKISIQQYTKALKKAVELLGNKGAVRSAFIVGLESKESLLEGVEYVCKLGVAPILSVFRPIPNTEMQDVIPADNEWLLDVYNEVEKICNKYNLKPGPTCVSCQNNTLAFDLIESRR